MTTRSTVTYLIAREGTEPAAALLAAAADALAGEGPIHLCRRPDRLALPSALPAAPSEWRGRLLDETWTAPLGWLHSLLDGGATQPLAKGLVVRAPWPLGAVAETTLLLARLSWPSVRIAVEVDAGSADSLFGYMNRLGFPWIAVPPTGARAADMAAALARLGRTWLFNPGTQSPVEPLIHALPAIIGRTLGREPAAWRYRALDAVTSKVVSGPWSPSVHAVLRAGAPLSSLASLEALDAAWMNELVEACASLDRDALREAAGVLNPVGGAR